MVQMTQPSRRDCRSVRNYLESDGGQIWAWDRQYVYEKEDLVTLKHAQEYAWLDGVVERVLRKFRCRMLEVRILISVSISQCAYKLIEIKFIFCSKVRINNPRSRSPLINEIQETKQKTDDTIVRYYSKERISSLVTLLIAIFVLILLIVPVWVLWRSLIQGSIESNPSTVILLVVFTLLFSTGLCVFTKAKRQEVLAASAG